MFPTVPQIGEDIRLRRQGMLKSHRRWLVLKRARERAEFGDRELLGACRGGDAGAREQCIHREPERL
jgi:hypothetical protein